MFSATQSITPLKDYGTDLNVRKTERPQNIEAKPACWSQNLIADLDHDQLLDLVQRLYEHKGFTVINNTTGEEFSTLNFHAEQNPNYNLLLATASQTDSVSIAVVKNFCDQAEQSSASESVFVTQGSFSSGALDYCARKPVSLISNRELLSLILKLDATIQSDLLAKITTS